MDDQSGFHPTSSTRMYRKGDVSFESFSTRSPKMLQCLRLAENVARADLSILITGESGTGKNLLAQAIHNASARAENAFITVNTSALSETLLESELFGHEKGAFTGATRLRHGQFELARAGTLVLDEIADMSLTAQPKILHAVEYKQFSRVGGEDMLHTDVRIIAITNHDLEDLAQSKRFRPELLYRLREVVIDVPALRERTEDIPHLCSLILEECQQRLGTAIAGISSAAMEALRLYPWPGNIRELKSVIRRGAVLSAGEQIELEHLGLPDIEAEAPSAPLNTDLSLEDDLTLSSAQQRHVLSVLELTEGNKRQAARHLGIARTTLDRILAAAQNP